MLVKRLRNHRRSPACSAPSLDSSRTECLADRTRNFYSWSAENTSENDYLVEKNFLRRRLLTGGFQLYSDDFYDNKIPGYRPTRPHRRTFSGLPQPDGNRKTPPC